MKRTLAPTLIAAGLIAGACTGSDGASTEPTDDVTDDGDTSDDPNDRNGDDGQNAGGELGPIGFAPAGLRQFDECGAFLDFVRTEGAERVGAYGFGNNGWWPVGPVVLEQMPMIDVAMEDDAMDDAAMESADTAVSAPAPVSDAAGRGDGGGADGSFSTTNVQVDGVDEPDIVKTDGARILAIANERLHLASVTDDGTDATVRSSIDLSDPATNQWMWGAEILFDGDRAFVIGQSEVWGPYDDVIPIPEPVDAINVDGSEGDAEAEFADETILPVEPDAPIGGAIPPPNGYQGPTTIVHEIDLSNPDAVSIVNTLEVRGRYVSARQIGSTARVVVTSPPVDLGFVFPSDDSERAIDAATETNQRLVAESDLEHWLPTYTLRTASGGAAQGQLVDCADIHAPSEFAGFDMLSVVTFGTDESLDAPGDTTSVMASGDTVYASQDRMYITSNVWLPPTVEDQELGRWEEEYETQIHRFSIAGDDPAAYEASGTVDGHLLNQFSMNDRDGTFFVATTEGTPWGATDTDNQIIAMQVDGDQLVEVGRVDDLGLEGERIFSVRYVDDLAYLVTFRETDPFYVLDLADPTDMRVLGELKIPGFSSYLHPISDTLVLGVGQDADESGFTTGTKVSLFDVSDRSNPIELDVWTLPGGGSDAEFDHRAFLYWPATQTAFLPVTQWSENFSGAVALRVTADGIDELGRISQEDPDDVAPGQTDCRVLSAEEFSEDEDGEFFWMAQEGLVLACDADDQGGATGFSCDSIPVDELRFWTADETVPEQFEGADRAELCWPEGIDWERQIRRTLIIDDSLWTLSNSRLQANDLTTLATGDVAILPR
ncbi:MAG: beta-propeller domain-containing protein [Actinomycetota bacterium]